MKHVKKGGGLTNTGGKIDKSSEAGVEAKSSLRARQRTKEKPLDQIKKKRKQQKSWVKLIHSTINIQNCEMRGERERVGLMLM